MLWVLPMMQMLSEQMTLDSEPGQCVCIRNGN